ncbi:LuxR C-terminal-related transcriptional regulator [Kribbella ginsengisoli]|uniref:HTH luxR-type domain-containing protein n=1 Tax=Kribbella ginsengisoli TaxID=363865 RepID=A0ABP6ZAU3_9ACTN
MEQAAEVLNDAGVTRRELQVFWLVADRLPNKEIAERLFLSERTVESHINSLLRKLGGSSRRSLLDLAERMPRRGTGSRQVPVPLSSLIGREAELSDLAQLVTEHRLVTLTGPPGAGKTRLALRTALTFEGLPAALVVDLTAVAPGETVERAFADALDISDGGEVRSALLDALSGGGHWLIVDNCEHVVQQAARLLSQLMASAPQLHILATSQSRLWVAGEAIYEVGPLDVPPDEDDPSAVLAATSAQLFAARAASALPGFTVDQENARAVATVCRRLDGLPLAIELAAARIRFMSPHELASHLDNRFVLLTGGTAEPGSRHRTLETALDWSYQLLDDREKLLLERCSVFPGDFDFDTAASVLTYSPLTASDVAHSLPRLLDRSLISSRRRGQLTEYRLLDSVRHFARQRLQERAGLELAEGEHASRHLLVARALATDLRGHGQSAAQDWYDRRWPDLRIAMRWALDHGHLDVAWEFLSAVGIGWEMLGVRDDLFSWLDELLRSPLPSGSLGIRSATTAAVVICWQDPVRAKAIAEPAFAASRGQAGIDDALGVYALGVTMTNMAEPGALQLLTESLERFEAIGDDWHRANALAMLGTAESELEPALFNLRRSADLFGAIGDRAGRSITLLRAVTVAMRSPSHLGEAQRLAREAEDLAQLAGLRLHWLHAQLLQADLDTVRDDMKSAGRKYGSLLPDFRRIGDRRCTCRCLLGLACSTGDEGAAAGEYAGEALQIAAELKDTTKMIRAMRMLARLRYVNGEPYLAAVLIGSADSFAERFGAGDAGTETADDALRAGIIEQLGREGFTQAHAEGATIPPARVLGLGPTHHRGT